MSDDVMETVFLRKEKLADKTWIFYFKKHFEFASGQYITIFLNKNSRDFTIASSPSEKEYFAIVTKEGVSNFKKLLFLLKPKETILLKYPVGGFILQKNSSVPHVFIAGGIGITPFYSMITYCSQKKLHIPLTLFVSFSKKDDIIFLEELRKIEEKNPLIKIIYSLSQDNWEGETGRVAEQLIKKYVSDLHSVQYLIAGGEQMVDDMETTLLGMGIDQSKIRIDIFTGY